MVIKNGHKKMVIKNVHKKGDPFPLAAGLVSQLFAALFCRRLCRVGVVLLASFP
jgi:hypothetical protein